MIRGKIWYVGYTRLATSRLELYGLKSGTASTSALAVPLFYQYNSSRLVASLGVYILHGCRNENESVLCLCCGCRDVLYVHSVTLIWSLPSEPMRLLTLWHITIEND